MKTIRQVGGFTPFFGLRKRWFSERNGHMEVWRIKLKPLLIKFPIPFGYVFEVWYPR